VRDRYGMHPLGQNLLLARRLVESGVGFVTVNGWTGSAPGQTGGGPPLELGHAWQRNGMGNAFGTGSYGMGWCLPCLDQGLSALFLDLRERGLLENTLVVVMGEVRPARRASTSPTSCPAGNTGPRACRHPRRAASAAGAVYGESDRIALVKDRPCGCRIWAHTIFHALGVPRENPHEPRRFTRPVSTGEPAPGSVRLARFAVACPQSWRAGSVSDRSDAASLPVANAPGSPASLRSLTLPARLRHPVANLPARLRHYRSANAPGSPAHSGR